MDPVEVTRLQTLALSSFQRIFVDLRQSQAESANLLALSSAQSEHESELALLRQKHADEIRNLRHRHSMQVEAAERLVRDVAPRIADEARKGLMAESKRLREEIGKAGEEREALQRQLQTQRKEHLRALREMEGVGS
mmetsp:Transcript_29826/g.68443  ORF Transcript_29826/g.68443 Transcript_29826/m.68443 type:complete len:137 (-) Transcript_29826:195-605(-)